MEKSTTVRQETRRGSGGETVVRKTSSTTTRVTRTVTHSGILHV